MHVRTCDLPGIGKRVSMVTSAGQMIVLILHHTGKKELYFFSRHDADEADFSLSLTNDEARELAGELLGITYQPVASDKVQAFHKEIMLEWLEVQEGSPLAEKSLKESQIGNRTGASVIGIIRKNEIVASPPAEEVIHAGDTLIAAGKATQIASLEKLCAKQ